MQPSFRIIGLSGTNGSGKDLFGELLAKRYHYLFVSVTELLREECRQRGLPVEREHLRTISAEWRREHGLAVLVDKAVAALQASSGTTQLTGVVMASLRNPYEADRVHELGGTMVWVDADPKVRYARVQANAAARGRAAEDTKTFEEFLAEEQAEMHAPAGADKAALNMAAVKERCDLFVENNSDDADVFAHDIAHALGLEKS